MTMLTQYNLETLSKMPDRALDALAHEAVFGDKPIEGSMFQTALVEGNRQMLPWYSSDREDVALLEDELLQRGMGDQLDRAMCDMPDKNNLPMIGAGRLAWLTVGPRIRTMAVIIAATTTVKED